MNSDKDRFQSLFEEEAYTDFAPERAGLNTWTPKHQYVGKSLLTISRENVMEILYHIDDLSGYEVGRLLPALLYQAIRNPDDRELQENLEKLDIHAMVQESRMEIRRALNDILTSERYEALLLALSDLIALHAYDDECGTVLMPLSRLKQLVCDATAWMDRERRNS